MKKFFTFAAAVLFALNVAATQKITIYVEEFEAASSVDDEIAEKVRAHVLTALSNSVTSRSSMKILSSL